MKKILHSILLLLLVAFAGSAQSIKGNYAIKNVQAEMLLRIKDANKANGTALVLYTPINWKCMTWEFKHIEGETYQLRNLFTGKTFQPKEKTAEGAELVQQPLIAAQENQQYEFISAAKNVYRIRLKGTTLYVTAAADAGRTNSAVILSKWSESKLQQWTIYEQNPTM
ncbi:MAG: RICIN domain-containing protein [Lacibacter sp.]